MSKSLPDRPNLDQYRKQAKDLLHAHRAADPAALERIRQHHPTLHNLPLDQIPSAPFTLADAQLILAREHSFESWPRFAAHITTLNLIRSLADIHNPVAAFIEFACAPRHSGHATGTLEHAQLILSRYPHVATANIHTAAILADEPTVLAFLTRDPTLATQKGGPHQWDALTHLCFSRYLRLDASRSEAFFRTAQTLIEAGASAATGWYETIDHPNPRPLFESAIYGAAAIARHPALTQLLLDHGANPNQVTRWGHTALHQSVLRDNGLSIIELLLTHGADPTITTPRHGSAAHIAARRGRADALDLFAQRNITITLSPLDQVIAACAQNNETAIRTLTTAHPNLTAELLAQGGSLPALGGILLAEFAGNNNAAGIRHLLALGVSPTALYPGDPYFEIPRDSTALHVAAWRAQPAAVQLLIESGTPINALDGNNRTALQLAIRAATDSYWKHRRTTESIEALLKAGATQTNITLPTGYPEADKLLDQYKNAE